MKEQEQVPVWRLVLSSQKGPTQQQQQQQLQCEASSLSWSLVSSGCFLSASGSSSSSQPAAIPPFTRLCFVEAKTSTILNSSCEAAASHDDDDDDNDEVKEETAIADAATMLGIKRISKGAKENIHMNLVGSSLIQLEQQSRNSLQDHSPRKRGILTDNSELCNSSTPTLKRRKPFEVPLPKQSKLFSVVKQRIEDQKTAAGSPRLFEINQTVFNAEMNQRMDLFEGKVNSHPYVDILDVREDQSFKEKKAVSSSCLFRTASGKSVPISKAAMNRAISLIGETGTDLKGGSARMNLSGARGSINSCGSLQRNFDRHGLEGQNVSGLFQSVSGKAVSISNSEMDRLIALSGEIGSSNPGTTRNGVITSEIYGTDLKYGSLKIGLLDQNVDAHPSEFDRNGTRISGIKLQDLSVRLDVLNENVNAHSHMGLPDFIESKNSEEPSIAPSSCLYQTATGRTLSMSNDGMYRAISLLSGEADSNCKVIGNEMGNNGIDAAGPKSDSLSMRCSINKVSTNQSGVLPNIVDQQNMVASACLSQNASRKAKLDLRSSEDGINSANIKDIALTSGEKVETCGHLFNNTKRKSSEEHNVTNLKDVSLRTTMLGNTHTYRSISNNVGKPCLDSSFLLEAACAKAVPISKAEMGRGISLFGEAGSHSEVARNRMCNDKIGDANLEDCSLRLNVVGDQVRRHPHGDISDDIKRNYDIERQTSAEQNVPTVSCLFRTAGGKTVSISNDGMSRAFSEEVSFNTEGVRNGMDNDRVDGANLNEGSAKMGLLSDKVSSHQYGDKSDDLRTEKPNVAASSCLFQTASGKTVSISNAAMNRATTLFSEKVNNNAEVRLKGSSKVGVDSINSKKGFLKCERTPNLSMFYTTQEQPVCISSSTMKQAAKLLGQEDLCFPAGASLASPDMTFMTGKGQSISVSSSAMKRARHLLAAELDESGVLMTDHVINGGGDDAQKLFQTGGHLIKVTSHSIERAKVLLGDSSVNNSASISKSTKTHIALDCPKVHELPHTRTFKPMTTRKFEESNVATSTRKDHLPRKYFKAPRRLQPEMTPKAISPFVETHILTPRTCFLQLVKVYPVHWKGKRRCSLRDFFMRMPHQDQAVGLLTKEVTVMTAETSKHYKFSTNVPGMASVGSDEFRYMLLETGANGQFATKEWVDNHFRWIIWKLASLERSYPTDMGNKLLSIQTVFDELRYRYEREVNCAHRSAIKRITEGDALAGTGLVLCIAAVGVKDNNQLESAKKTEQIMQTVDSSIGQIELTDGWYSIIGQLDQPLVRQLLAGKIFVGQKLRICGASLIGCTAPMPPLEAYQTMKLALHINGTYRAHWADKLGFCRCTPMPLAFHCIKHDGGLVPRTIIGISRIYPVAYYEKLPDNKSIIRSARGEELAIQSYQHRRNQVAEAAFMRMEGENPPKLEGDNMGEGAKLFHALESAAEPELLMADMTSAQLAAFAAYQTKREAAKQALIDKNIQKALGEVHLDVRQVTPFIEISVMGIVLSEAGKCNDESDTFKHKKQQKASKVGTVTMWHVTEEQVENLKEGAVYCVSNLYPLVGNFCSQNSTRPSLHLRATKLTKWHHLPHTKFASFSPRTALEVSLLGTISFSSEFDVAVLVVHVGIPYAEGLCKKQWLFVSDGSIEENPHTNTALLAISISATSDAFLPVDKSLEGCIVGYCNLIKRHRDQRNCLWVAESSKSSFFTVNLSSERFSHLRNAASKVDKWFKAYGGGVADLQGRIQAALCGAS